MTEEKLSELNELYSKIYRLEKSIKGLDYALSDDITEREIFILFNGIEDKSIRINKNHFKTLSKIMHSLVLNDLNEAKEQFKKL